MRVAHPDSLKMVLAAHTWEPGLGIKAVPLHSPLGPAGPVMLLGDSHVSGQREREKAGQSGTVDAPLISKWVAVDKVSNQRASKTLISLLIPHLPLPTLHPQSMG